MKSSIMKIEEIEINEKYIETVANNKYWRENDESGESFAENARR